jgi:cobalt-zinc-cadmium resistance protein CzcA
LVNANEKSYEIAQSFDFPTLYFARGSKAVSDIEVAKSSAVQIINKIRTTVEMSYLTAQTKLQLMKTAEENLKIATEFLDKADIRYKSGEGTDLEFMTAKVQLTESKAMLETAKRDYYTAMNELCYNIGNIPGVDPNNLDLSDSLDYKPLNINFDDLLEKARNLNPYLKHASYLLESSKINRNIAWMGLLPSFEASYMMQATDGVSNFYGFRLGLNLPLWFLLDQKGRIQEAEADYQVSNYSLTTTRNDMEMKIRDAFIDFQHDEKQVILYRTELMPQSEEIFRSASLSYQEGEISYLEYLQAKTIFTNIRSNYIKSLFDYNEAIINLEEASGVEINQ